MSSILSSHTRRNWSPLEPVIAITGAYMVDRVVVALELRPMHRSESADTSASLPTTCVYMNGYEWHDMEETRGRQDMYYGMYIVYSHDGAQVWERRLQWTW